MEYAMKTGMLWFDNDPKTDLPTKIARAAAYYQSKYGQHPDLCFVHPAMLGGSILRAHENIEVRPNRAVLPNHLWIGIHELPVVSF
jgi:hypothetical protein